VTKYWRIFPRTIVQKWPHKTLTGPGGMDSDAAGVIDYVDVSELKAGLILSPNSAQKDSLGGTCKLRRRSRIVLKNFP
jgi:hypothetical protein